ncbi:selenocysteine-specific translation elongation factor [Microvirga massiliensis]|uniref:selenocysteine-specific translation elongation factor n=1 Tax=Microvirga massiliensis TaxID=1033741 RepID=UPI00062BE350|nr:selenocysteine-specific translation elongation factor [Microvirga massiliensis]
MKSISVGVIGHVDHGKTALVRALTGIETDRLAEEKARGVSIVPGFALLRTPGGEIDLIDLPGHERFIRAMISGATGVKAVLVAVSAIEGIKPQTVEHLEIARFLGIRRGVMALTMCDRVETGECESRRIQLRALADEFGIEESPIIPISVVTGAGIQDVARCLSDLAASAPESRDDGFAYLPVDRVFSVAGFGTVVTGTLRRGMISKGDWIEVWPSGRRARIRTLQIHGRFVESAVPGRRTAVGLRDVSVGDLRPGHTLVTPGIVVSNRWLDASVTVCAGDPRGLANGDQVRLLIGTTDAAVRIRLLEHDTLRPGETGLCQFRCDEDVVAPVREPFILRAGSPSRTVAGGRILDPASRRRRRFDAMSLESLKAMAAGRPGEALLGRLREAGLRGCAVGELAWSFGVDESRLRRRLHELGAQPEGALRVIDPHVWSDLLDRVARQVAEHHRVQPLEYGLPRERMLAFLPSGLDADLAKALLGRLVETGILVVEKGLYWHADFRPQDQISPRLAAIEDLCRRARLNAPSEAEIVGQGGENATIVAHLVRAEVLIRAVDRVQRRVLLFHRDAMAAARTSLARRWPHEQPFLAGEAGALLGISRKYSIPLLEHLDRVGFTRRIGDQRIVIEKGAESDSRHRAHGPTPAAAP